VESPPFPGELDFPLTDGGGVVGELAGDKPIGGGLFGVGFGITPVPAVAAVDEALAGDVAGDPAFGGVTGAIAPFSVEPMGFFKAPGLNGGDGVTRLGPALSIAGPPPS